MSITSEIERIKTNIANAYTELENKGATIPTQKNSNNLASTITTVTGGGDATINGVIEQKTVASGSVAKGDFVVATEQSITHKLSESDIYYQGDAQNSSYPLSHMLDDDPNSYFWATKSGSYANVYVKTKFPSYSELGIPKDSLILGCGLEVTHRNTSNMNQDSLQAHFYKYSDFSTGSGTVLNRTDLTKSKEMMTDNVYVPFIFKAEDLENYGFTIYAYSYSNGVYLALYDAIPTITYLDNGIVKTATTTADTIVGVANSDGTEGDTIDVYIPNVGEEGVSYMNRMMEMNEELQEKATAYDILTGEEE